MVSVHRFSVNKLGLLPAKRHAYLYTKAARVLLYPDRSAHALLPCIRSFARLDGHEAEELGEE